MGKLYVGNSGSTPAIIKVEEVAKKKLGVSIDNFIGEVKDGVVSAVDTTPVIDFSGIKTVENLAFDAFFQGRKGWIKNVNQIKEVGIAAFSYMFNRSPYFVMEQPARFDSLESVTGYSAFESFADSADEPIDIAKNISFPVLKAISGQHTFKRAFKPLLSEKLPLSFVDDLFPVLERIEGYQIFDNFIYYGNAPKFTFSSVKSMIMGQGSSTYYALFGTFYSSGTVWKFPRATELSGYVWDVGSSYTGEIHFAAANQTALEACSGYDKKWGFAGATIYFDLMLNITVNGIVYSRKRIINDYTSWEDDLGNLVYTDANVEPAVGTVVYSDAGTTQVGTVEAVA